MAHINPQQSRIISDIVDRVKPLKIILFGSIARGDDISDSDLDILVLMPEGTNRRKTAQMLYREVQTGGTPYDLVVATPSDLEKFGEDPGLIYRAILREGVVIYAA